MILSSHFLRKSSLNVPIFIESMPQHAFNEHTMGIDQTEHIIFKMGFGDEAPPPDTLENL